MRRPNSVVTVRLKVKSICVIGETTSEVTRLKVLSTVPTPCFTEPLEDPVSVRLLLWQIIVTLNYLLEHPTLGMCQSVFDEDFQPS